MNEVPKTSDIRLKHVNGFIENEKKKKKKTIFNLKHSLPVKSGFQFVTSIEYHTILFLPCKRMDELTLYALQPGTETIP